MTSRVIDKFTRSGLDVFQRDPGSDKLHGGIHPYKSRVLVQLLLRAAVETERLKCQRRPFEEDVEKPSYRLREDNRFGRHRDVVKIQKFRIEFSLVHARRLHDMKALIVPVGNL